MSVPIPITVFTGFLGAGKTSTILSLLPQLPKDYKVVLLKNEFGDVQVDSQLAKESSLAAVSEILNGCMCCVLVGKMQAALLEIRDQYRPDRIIIECSGSAFPATLAFQIRELERETNGDLKLDAIVTVIDAENFTGYEDASPTARMQAKYTDIILINKWENVSERALDIVMDHLNTLNDLTPKIRCGRKTGADPNLIFGIGSQQFLNVDKPVEDHNDEVETVTIYRGSSTGRQLLEHSHDHHEHEHEHSNSTHPSHYIPITKDLLTTALSVLSRETIWRVKGFIRLASEPEIPILILNWAFARFELTPATGYTSDLDEIVKFTVMGSRGEVKHAAKKFAALLGADVI